MTDDEWEASPELARLRAMVYAMWLEIFDGAVRAAAEKLAEGDDRMPEVRKRVEDALRERRRHVN